MPQLSPDLVLNGRYQLQRPIGRGGFSLVWLALDLSLTKPVALKVSLPDKDPSGEQPARMEYQHQTTKHLRHPHLLCSHDFFRVEDAGCLVFDYMANGTLHQRIRSKGVLEEVEIAKVISQIADALRYLHSHSLVHFDVKPENILIDAKGNYFLSDFDTASRMENSMVRVSRIYADTPQYRSPEHLRGASELSEKIDIFAFGTTIFETCEGIMEKEYGIGMMLLGGGAKPEITTSSYSKRLEQFIHACWNHNPVQRPSAEVLVSYGEQMLSNRYWPTILEYNPDDKPVADLPHGSGSETARVTIGQYSTPNPSLETRENKGNSSTFSTSSSKKDESAVYSNSGKSKVDQGLTGKFSERLSNRMKGISDSRPVRFVVLGLLFLALLATSTYFINHMIRMRNLTSRLAQAEKLSADQKLKSAYELLVEVCKQYPDDENAKKQRLAVLSAVLNMHRSDLDQVKQAIAFNEVERYPELCQLLEQHKENASILVMDDSTQYYQSLIPDCSPKDTRKQELSGPDSQEQEEKFASQNSSVSEERIVSPASSTRKQYQNDDLAQELKRLKEEQQRDDQAWKIAKVTHTKEAYESYLSNWKMGRHTVEAKNAIEKLSKLPPGVKGSQPSALDESSPQFLSKNSSAGLPLSEREQSCKKLSEGGAIRLQSNTFIELSELTLYCDGPGKIMVSLQDANGKKLGSVRCLVSSGRTQCNLTDLSVRLKPNNVYFLVFTPSRNEKGGMPLIENMKDCSPIFTQNDLLRIDYQGNFIVFDLKFSH